MAQCPALLIMQLNRQEQLKKNKKKKYKKKQYAKIQTSLLKNQCNLNFSTGPNMKESYRSKCTNQAPNKFKQGQRTIL